MTLILLLRRSSGSDQTTLEAMTHDSNTTSQKSGEEVRKRSRQFLPDSLAELKSSKFKEKFYLNE